ncbi:BREX system P-loop protein BrxC [Dasania marina]|uniref:BREX system P-loop protein BrxC n=1 Tax=Dasania marina TaxID=471499 RepID=UPI00038066F0|nr:BREX system P-loop protein BrxC [Dasania marina]
MLNREIFQNDPVDNFLANNGVAKVSEEKTAEALKTLEYELKTFVCDGKYKEGMELILSNYLASLKTKNEQKGVWISGFFGSGKSHLAKMLASLWVNQAFPGSQSARGIADLPDTTVKLLEQLTDESHNHPGLHAASGTLGASAGKKVRLSLLAIIFKSLGLPEQYHLAKFCLWLKSEGVYEQVKQSVTAKVSGAEAEALWVKEVRNLHVSPFMHKAVIEALPQLATDPKEAREMLRSQYAIVEDVSNDEMVDALVEALAVDGQIPLTLVVLDEVQQYIGNDIDRAHDIQEAVETCCKASQLKSKVLFVATGQSALAGMSSLQRLMGRFQTPVQLEDTDVDAVIRKVILQKKESARANIEDVLQSNLGEISRHLHGSTIEHNKDDEQVIVADYPLLPVRRRFWEKVLHALDVTGTGSQLRNQLRIVHEACKSTANQSLGHVLPADFIYDQIATNLLQTSMISKDIYETISRKKAGDHDSQQQGRVLALILLIGKLPTDVDHGIAPTEEFIADLLIEDLTGDKNLVRSQVPGWLQSLEKEGLLMSMQTDRGLEYRLQTAESAQWYDEFNQQKNQYRGNPQRIEGFKQQLIQQHIRQALGKSTTLQGASKVSRPIQACFEAELPNDADKKLYAWVHTGSEKAFLDQARGARPEEATLFIYVPNSNQSDVADALIEQKAAEMTLEIRGVASTEAGGDARKAMENRKNAADRKLTQLLKDIFAAIQVKLAGGADVEGVDLIEQLTKAGQIAVERLYSDFALADDPNWEKVYNKACREGGENALEGLGYSGETVNHPVCEAVRRFIGVGKQGREIISEFSAAPYGWPLDSIDGVLFAMLAAGVLTGTDATGQPVDAKSLVRTQLSQVNLRPERVQLSKVQLIKIRGLITGLGVDCSPGQEQSQMLPALKNAKALAYSSGGDAPLPASPSTEQIDDLMSITGNELLSAALDAKDELLANYSAWQATIELAQARNVQWGELRDVLHHCRGLAFEGLIDTERQAIITNRSLLVSPNPIEPLIKQAFSGIRDSIMAHLGEYETEYGNCLNSLEADEQWQKLPADEQQQLRDHHSIASVPRVELDTNERVLQSLEDCSLSQWNDKRASLMSKFEAARNAAIAKLAPKVQRVSTPRRLIESEEDLNKWLAEAEQRIRAQLANGPVSVS